MINSTIEEDFVGLGGQSVDSPSEGSGGWEENEDLWVNVTGDENGIYLSGNVTLFIKYKIHIIEKPLNNLFYK